MTSTTISKPIMEVVVGDKTPWYEVTRPPERIGDEVIIMVRFNDGGVGQRAFMVDDRLVVSNSDD